jgi:hypothetical protein
MKHEEENALHAIKGVIKQDCKNICAMQVQYGILQ